MCDNSARLNMADSLRSMNGSIYSLAYELTDIRLDEFLIYLTQKWGFDLVLWNTGLRLLYLRL